MLFKLFTASWSFMSGQYYSRVVRCNRQHMLQCMIVIMMVVMVMIFPLAPTTRCLSSGPALSGGDGYYDDDDDGNYGALAIVTQ